MDKQTKKPISDNYYYVLAIRIATDLSVTIAAPALIATYFGQKLDESWGTKPWMMVLLLIIAFTLTAVIIKRKAEHYAKLYDRK